MVSVRGYLINSIVFTVFVFGIVPFLFKIPFHNTIPVDYELTNLRTIIFDFDGTIADTFDYYNTLSNIVAEENGFRRIEDPETVRGQSVIDTLRGMGMSVWQFPKYGSMVIDSGFKNRDSVVIFDGMKEVIIELSKKYMLGIVTSNEKRVAEYILDKYEMLEYFEFVEGTGLTSLKHLLKGKSGVIKDMISEYSLKREEVIYVGDEVSDIVSSRKAYLKTLVVCHGFNNRQYLMTKNPEYIAEDTQEMYDILMNM